MKYKKIEDARAKISTAHLVRSISEAATLWQIIPEACIPHAFLTTIRQ